MNFNEIFGKNVTYNDIKSDYETKIYTLNSMFFKYILGIKARHGFFLMKLQCWLLPN